MSAPVDRTQPPSPGAIRPFDFPDVERRALPNGLDLRVARMSRLPVVSVNVFMRAGEAALRPERAGLAVLAGDALEGGTRKRSGSALAEALEKIGARLSVTTGWEGTSVSLSCLADRLGDGLTLLAETILEPEFPEDEVRRAREQHLAGLRQRAMDPGSLASDHAMLRYFAPHVPYARPLGGRLDSIEPVNRSDLIGYADAFYRPEGGAVVVAGDVDLDEMASTIMDRFARWKGAPLDGDAFTVEPAHSTRTVWVVHRPGSVQSEIRIGHVGVARSDPDYFPLMVTNTLFGGTFTSRLNLNLRERRGFTYGVRSHFAFRRQAGPFEVSTAVGNEVTAPAVSEILFELDRLAAEGPTEDEVSAARDYAAGVFPLRLETVAQVAARVTELVVYDLPEDYHHTYRDRVRSVTAAAAAAAAARHVKPAEAQVVVVGDSDAIGPPLEALEVGPVEVVR